MNSIAKPNIKEISAVILAGGQGSRMNNQDKGLLPFRDKTLIEHVLARLAGQVDTILINANRNVTEYIKLGHSVILDQIDGFAGPLAGIDAGFDAIQTPWLIVLPCDTPFIPLDYVARMWASRDDHRAYVAHDGQRQQSAFCLLHRELRADLQQFLHGQRRSIYGFLEHCRARPVDFSDQADAFINLNTMDELQRFD